MNIAENNFTPLLFTKNIEEIPFGELKEIAAQYPYFAVANFFLAKKMKLQNDPGFLQQVQKTALYFSNPFWLHYQLLHDIPVAAKKETEPAALNVIEPEKINNHLKETLTRDIEQVLSENLDEDELKQMPSLKLSEMLKEQAADFKKPVEADAKISLIPEPFHTVDYFASQGIKLDLLQPQDKLGIKVRRFTDWLKQMKSINPHPADLGTDTVMENKVQDTAATSNQPKEVLTESMAEVLAKQGKTEQAIQLYIKLSFLDPHKSAYFAARIENLKGL